MKSLTLDKNSIRFVEMPESKPKKIKTNGIETLSLDSLNTLLLSEPFTIKEGMTLSFSESAGFIAAGDNSDSSEVKLSGKNYSFDCRIELVEDGTNKSVAVIKQSKFTTEDKQTDDLKVSNVKITGKGEQKVRLKITLTSSAAGIKGMLVDEINTINENILSKLSAEEITLNDRALVTDYKLEQNYPNPFNPTTVINYQLPKDGYVTLKIYDILGKEVKTLVKEYKSHGSHSVEFNASGLSSGTYIYELRVNDYTSVKKLMLLK